MAGPFSLAGTGIVTLDAPAALIVSIQTFGSRVVQGGANPPNYRNVGMLTPGDADAWFRTEGISANPQKIVLPPSCTRLGYAMIAGSQVTVTEVPPPALTPSALNPWDRHPVPVNNAVFTGINGDGQMLTLWQYTVPAAQIFCCTTLLASTGAFAPGSAASDCLGHILVNGAVFLSSGVGPQAQDTHSGGPSSGGDVYFPAGTVLLARAQNNNVGGQVLVSVAASGYAFDA